FLTLLSGTTNASGEITTQFAPGFYTGNVLITAKPVALQPASVPVTKTIGQTISQELSTISAVPKYVPADGEAFSEIRVTVRNTNNIGIPNRQVTLTSSLGIISPPPTLTTNALGQATFFLRSTTVGTANLVANVDGITLETQA